MSNMADLIIEYYDHERVLRHRHVTSIQRSGRHPQHRLDRKVRSIFPRGKIGDKIPKSIAYVSNPIS